MFLPEARTPNVSGNTQQFSRPVEAAEEEGGLSDELDSMLAVVV